MAEPTTEGTAAPADTSAADEAAYQAGLAAIREGRDPDAPAEPKAEAKPAAKPAAEGDDTETDEDAPEAAATEEAPEAEEPAEEESKVDKAALARLAKEKASFERHKTEVLEKERQIVAREQRVAKGETELRSLFTELNTDPVGTLLKHNLISEADFKFYSQQFLLLSPEGLKDPRSKPEAERLRRERARDIEARRALAEVEALRKEREEEKAAAATERQLNEYVASIDTSVPAYKAKTPLLAKAMEKDAAATRRELYQVAYELGQANGGQFVEPGRVLLAWEKQQRERIARLGLAAPSTAAPAAPQSKAKTPTAAKSQGQKPPAAQAAEDPDIAASEEEYRAGLQARLKRAP